MSCRLIFIRHGQSLGNKVGKFLGHTDLDLSHAGYRQAELVGNFLKDISIDNIYSSDLLRAYNTSLPLSKLKDLKVEKRKELREIFAGDWENKEFTFLLENFSEAYSVWINNIGAACPDNGESVALLQKRIVEEVERIAKENDGKTVAVFTHATPIRTLFAYIREMSIEEIKDIPWATNASLSEAVYENGKFTEICYSDDSFLAELITRFPKNV